MGRKLRSFLSNFLLCSRRPKVSRSPPTRPDLENRITDLFISNTVPDHDAANLSFRFYPTDYETVELAKHALQPEEDGCEDDSDEVEEKDVAFGELLEYLEEGNHQGCILDPVQETGNQIVQLGEHAPKPGHGGSEELEISLANYLDVLEDGEYSLAYLEDEEYSLAEWGKFEEEENRLAEDVSKVGVGDAEGCKKGGKIPNLARSRNRNLPDSYSTHRVLIKLPFCIPSLTSTWDLISITDTMGRRISSCLSKYLVCCHRPEVTQSPPTRLELENRTTITQQIEEVESHSFRFFPDFQRSVKQVKREISEEEVRAAAAYVREEVDMRNRFSVMNAPKDSSSVNNKYYNLTHAVNERVVEQPSILCQGTLREYQLVGSQWMLSLYNNKLNGILADEMGLGKTVQVMALTTYLMEFKGNYGPHLTIVPNAVSVNWKSELHSLLPTVSCTFYVGAKDQRVKLFNKDRSKLSKIDWKYIILDEAQRMKDRESVLAHDLDKDRCHRRLLLIGAPLQNDLKELWSLLNLLLPEIFDNSKVFHDWFLKLFQKDAPSHDPGEDDWLETEKKVIISHQLHQILEPSMLRRRVEDVERSLPPKVSVVLRCRMSAMQSAIYHWVKTTGTIRVVPEEEVLRTAKNPNHQVQKYRKLQNKYMELRKACNHPLLNYPYFNEYSNDFIVRSCGELWILDRILIKLQRAGHRVLLFSTMTKLLDLLEEYLLWRRLVYRRIDGTTSLEDRESAITSFNSPDSDCFIFLLSIRAAGRGLNLQTADTVVIYDPDPNPQNKEQAVARAHRIGQKREVKVIYMEAVVDKIPSYQNEDELRNGGTGDSEDDLASKDRYVGSIESLIRRNIQQYKIDMADEVINAGRFDQRTTHEERRMTLETLLHDDERYQETVHDVPSLQQGNWLDLRPSGSFIHDHEDGEDEQVLQPKRKHKRSIPIRPIYTAERYEEKSSGLRAFSHCGSQLLSPVAHDYEKQLRHERELKEPADPVPDVQDMSTSALKPRRRRSLTSRKVAPATQNSGRSNQVILILYDWWKRNANASNLLNLEQIEQRVDNFEYSDEMDFIADVQLMLKTVVRQCSHSYEVRHEAEKVQKQFFDIVAKLFPHTDVREARNAATFSNHGPSLKQSRRSTRDDIVPESSCKLGDLDICKKKRNGRAKQSLGPSLCISDQPGNFGSFYVRFISLPSPSRSTRSSFQKNASPAQPPNHRKMIWNLASFHC